jgi:chromosome segregation ATPase
MSQGTRLPLKDRVIKRSGIDPEAWALVSGMEEGVPEEIVLYGNTMFEVLEKSVNQMGKLSQGKATTADREIWQELLDDLVLARESLDELRNSVSSYQNELANLRLDRQRLDRELEIGRIDNSAYSSRLEALESKRRYAEDYIAQASQKIEDFKKYRGLLEKAHELDANKLQSEFSSNTSP